MTACDAAGTSPEGRQTAVDDVRNVIIIGSGPAGYTAAVYAARANLHAAGVRGLGHRRWRADEHHRGRELPRLPRRHHGPGPDGRHARAGRALRRRARHRRRHRGRPHRRRSRSSRTAAATTHRARVGDPRDRLRLPQARPARREASCPATASPGAPPATASSSATRTSPSSAAATPRSRRRRSSPGSPRSVTVDPPPRRAARLARSCRSAPSPTTKIEFAWNSEVADDRRRGQARAGVALRDTVTGEERDARRRPACSSRSATTRARELFAGQVDLDDEGYVLVERPSHPDQPRRRLRRGDLVDHTYRQAVTAAGTGCAAALDAERYLAGARATRSPPATRSRPPRPALV